MGFISQILMQIVITNQVKSTSVHPCQWLTYIFRLLSSLHSVRAHSLMVVPSAECRVPSGLSVVDAVLLNAAPRLVGGRKNHIHSMPNSHNFVSLITPLTQLNYLPSSSILKFFTTNKRLINTIQCTLQFHAFQAFLTSSNCSLGMLVYLSNFSTHSFQGGLSMSRKLVTSGSIDDL